MGRGRVLGPLTSAAELRVLHLVPHISIGGAELQLHHLIAHTPPGRARHLVLYYADANDLEAQRLFDRSRVDARRIPRDRRFSLGFLRRLIAAIEEARPDIVHCWLPSACLWGRLAARGAGARRMVFSIRSSRIELAPLLRLARLAGDRGVYYLANSRAVAASIRRDIGAAPGRIAIVPNGVESAAPEGPPARDSLLAAHGGTPETRIVLSVGRLALEKNYPMLLRVAARFKPEDPVRFFIVGPGELEAALKRQARQLGLEERVHFLGLRRDIPALLRAADLFAFTSRSEGAPNALLEAMAAGLPIVTTRFAGFDDIVTPDRDARVIDHDDDAAFEAAVRSLLEDRARARELGDRARRTAADRFGVPAMVEATLAFYRRILEAAD